jgi:hypothetical protein
VSFYNEINCVGLASTDEGNRENNFFWVSARLNQQSIPVVRVLRENVLNISLDICERDFVIVVFCGACQNVYTRQVDTVEV